MVLGQLKAKRESKEWTKEDLASAAGMTVRNVDYLESGKGTTLNTAKRLAKLFKCSVEVLK